MKEDARSSMGAITRCQTVNKGYSGGGKSSSVKSIFGYMEGRQEKRQTRVNPEVSGEQQVAPRRSCARPTPRGGSEKNAPLILHQRPTKKAAKNAALSIERPGPTHADAVPPALHRYRRVRLTPPRDTRLFFLLAEVRGETPPFDIFASAFGGKCWREREREKSGERPPREAIRPGHA